MQIKKLAKLHLCAHLKVRLIHICACEPDIMAVLDLRVAAAGERMFPPSIHILPSRQTVHGRFDALSVSSTFIHEKHFKFRWQNWLDIPLAVVTIFTRLLDNRADLPLPSLCHQKSVSFPRFPLLLLLHADWISISVRFTCMTDAHAYTRPMCPLFSLIPSSLPLQYV